MSYRVPESEEDFGSYHSDSDGLTPLHTARTFLGWPLENCATTERICLTDQKRHPCFLLPPSGKITQVPHHQIGWRQSPDGILITDVEYGEPVDLPDDGVVGVITLDAYYDLQVWNANCGRFEKVDLSWLVVLGEPVGQPQPPFSSGRYGHRRSSTTRGQARGYRNLYRGLILTPEVKANRELMDEDFLRTFRRPFITRDLIPEV